MALTFASAKGLGVLRAQSPDDPAIHLPPELRESVVDRWWPFTLWDVSVSFQLGGGYNSNPSLTAIADARQPSSFLEYGGDLLFVRVPTDGNTLSILLGGSDRRYFGTESVLPQQSVFTQFSFLHESPSWWSAGVNATWLHINEVVDLSSLDNGLLVGTGQLQGQTVIVRPNLSARLGTNWLASVELPLTRQAFSEPADSYYEVGPQALLTRKLPHDSTASLGYSWTWRPYDDSPQINPNGEILLGGGMERLQYHSANFRWQQNWDADKHWRTLVNSSYTIARDSGGGYYDYNSPRVSGQFTYRTDRWEVTASASAIWYHYTQRTVSAAETALRERREYTAGLRFKYEFTEHVSGLLGFEWESSKSNFILGGVAVETYNAKTVSLGIQVEY
ncbi:MAG: hypothetical protein KIT22_10230 [Verrucomicrobiae bacterium]|nr:hypothetical protein [Verrucomicrobiae bacterium]